MRAGVAAALVAWLVGAVVTASCTAPGVGQSEDLCAWRAYELTEASAAGVVRLKITGTGRYCGNSIRITVTPTVHFSLRIRVEPGTVLLSSVPGEQDMVVRRVRGRIVAGWEIEPSVDIEVKCDETETYILEAYCLDRNKGIPSSTTEFRIGGRARREVAKVIAVLPANEGASVDAIQRAIWVATGDMLLSEIRSSDTTADRQADEILTSARFGSGADVLSYILQVLAAMVAVLLLGVLNAVQDLW
jgi:hypothetical protein